MTRAEKCRAVAQLFDQGREIDAYAALASILESRPWPGWLKSACADINTLTKKEPVRDQ